MTTEIKTVRNLIDGKRVDAADGKTMRILNPATGETIAFAPVSCAADVDHAVRVARRNFEAWSLTHPAERARLLHRVADAFEKAVDEFVVLERVNNGKPKIAFLGDEIPWIIDLQRYYAGAARHLGGSNSGEYDSYQGVPYTSIFRREPLGVIGSIIPAAFPTLMAVWKLFPALAAGNTVVLKPAEQVPLPILKLVEIFNEVLPPGVVNVVLGTADAGRALVTHDGVDMISFIGTNEAGEWITRNAGIKRLSLGLGNSAPAIVFNDADLEFALPRIAQTGFYNAGQDCASTSRVIVSADIYDVVVKGLVDLAKTMPRGDLSLPETIVGPMIAESYRERVSGFLKRRPSHAEILVGGKPVNGPGFYFEPTLITGVHQDDELVQSEVYGPVITVQRFSSEEEALALANGTRYGLTGSLWTTDLRRAVHFIRRLQLGNVNVNETSKLVTEKPYSGYKQSGYGSDTGIEALEGYTRIKSVTLRLP
jgi:betaine-aldehyde dehydrogenase